MIIVRAQYHSLALSAYPLIFRSSYYYIIHSFKFIALWIRLDLCGYSIFHMIRMILNEPGMNLPMASHAQWPTNYFQRRDAAPQEEEEVISSRCAMPHTEPGQARVQNNPSTGAADLLPIFWQRRRFWFGDKMRWDGGHTQRTKPQIWDCWWVVSVR